MILKEKKFRARCFQTINFAKKDLESIFLNDVEIQLILEFKRVIKNIIQSFIKFLKIFFGTPCGYNMWYTLYICRRNFVHKESKDNLPKAIEVLPPFSNHYLIVFSSLKIIEDNMIINTECPRKMYTYFIKQERINLQISYLYNYRQFMFNKLTNIFIYSL